MSDPNFPNPDEIQRRLSEFLKNQFGQNVSFTSNVSQSDTAETDEPPGETPTDLDPFEFSLTPRDVKRHLDRYVIRQEEAKKVLSIAVCDHYNHVRECARDPELAQRDYSKQNVLLVGPTGVGKTYLIKHIAELIGVPFVKADATKFSETGYVGGDVDDLVRELYHKAGGNLQLAQSGIIYIDEIDKLAAAPTVQGRDVSGRGVQTALLKLMEETEVTLRSPMDMQSQIQAALEFQRKGKVSRDSINTRNILFIVSGAFQRIAEQIRRRVAKGTIGFQGAITEELSEDGLIAQANTRDFIDFGFEPEFIGRLPVRVFCHSLTDDDLFEILKTSEGSVLRQYEAAFRAYDIEAHVEEDAMRWIASQAAKEETGARGLVTICERLFRDFKYELPGNGVDRIQIDQSLIDDPEGTLRRLLEEGQSQAAILRNEELEQFCLNFREKHGFALRFKPDAARRVIERATQSGMSVQTWCERAFKDYQFGLNLVRNQLQEEEFTLPLEAVDNPDQFLSQQVLKSYREENQSSAEPRSGEDQTT